MAGESSDAALVRRLLAEVQADRRALAERTDDVRAFSQPAAASPERAAALALSLDRSYTALESILERIARSLEGGAPAGDDWHRALLRNAALDIEKVRPAILGSGGLQAADELRRFRHFLRHAYAVSLDAERIGRLAVQWLAAWPSLSADLDRFEEFLRKLAERLAGS